MSDDPATALSRIAWQKLLIWGLFLLAVYYLRELFLIVFLTFLMSYIIRNLVAALKNRIAPGAARPWLDRLLTLATFAGLLICVGAVFALVGPRFLQQSRLLLVQLEGIQPQDTLNSLLDRTVGVYLLRRTYGEPGDEQYDEVFQKYQQQGRRGEGLYHDFPAIKSHLESAFELASEQTNPSQFKTFYKSRRADDPTAVPLPYDLYMSLSDAYPKGKAAFAKVLQAQASDTTESPQQKQDDFERATRRELTRKWWANDPAAASLREHVQQDAPQVAEAVAIRIEEVIRGLIALPAQLVTALLLTIFITLDFNELKEGCERLRDTRIRDIFDEIATGLVILARLIGKSFSAQGVIALFNTLFTFVLLWLLGIRNELLFCALVFIASFIPVVGVFLSGIPITIQAILQPGGSIGLAAQVVVGIILIHLIEASVLSPKIVGKVLHLQPVMVLAILAIGEHLFGIWGLLLGVPVAVYIIRVVILNEPIPGIYDPADGTTARQL